MRFTILFLLVFPLTAFCEEHDKVSIHPNPASDEISVKIGEHKDAAMVKIITQEGNVVWSEHRDETEFKLDLELYPPGVYYVQISVLDKVEIYRFVKK